MLSYARYVDFLDDIKGLDVTTELVRLEDTYHFPSGSSCLEGLEHSTPEAVNVLQALKDETLCPECWKWSLRRDALYESPYALEQIRSTHASLYEPRPDEAPWARFREAAETLHAHTAYPRVYPLTEWSQETVKSMRERIAREHPAITSLERKDLAVAYARHLRDKSWAKLDGAEGTPANEWTILKWADATSLTQALTKALCTRCSNIIRRESYRTGLQSSKTLYAHTPCCADRAEGMAAELAAVQAPLTSEDLEPVLFTVQFSGLRQESGRALLATSHYLAIKEDNYLVHAPRVVYQAIRNTMYVPAYHASIPPGDLDRVVEMWNPADPLFGDLDKLVEAAALIR